MVALIRDGWESIRPDAYKAGGTGKALDAYNKIAAADYDPAQSEANLRVATALKLNIAERLTTAKKNNALADFFDSKAQKTWVSDKEAAVLKKKPFTKPSPESVGEQHLDKFKKTMGEWITEIDKRIEGLEKAAKEAKGKRNRAIEIIGDQICETLLANFEKDCAVPVRRVIEAALLQKQMPGEGPRKNFLRLIQGAKDSRSEKAKPLWVARKDGAMETLAVKQFSKIYGYAPDIKDLPPFNWVSRLAKAFDDLGDLIEKAEE